MSYVRKYLDYSKWTNYTRWGVASVVLIASGFGVWYSRYLSKGDSLPALTLCAFIFGATLVTMFRIARDERARIRSEL